jgi:cyclophilin family peptidyl-prolyl cis-trans isomerase
MKRRTMLGALAALGFAAQALAQETPASPISVEPVAPPAPKVTLTTTMGVVEITLDPVGAPKTSAHMLALFQSGHYVGAAIYRIEPGFLIQLGDLDAQFKHRWPPGGTVALETATNRHARGTVSLARAEDPDSGLSTFYFDLADNPSLNATPGAPPNTTGYATFGRVTAGMEVLDAIAKVERAPTGGPFPGTAPVTPIVITSVVTDPPPPPKPRAAAPAPAKGKAKAKTAPRRRAR